MDQTTAEIMLIILNALGAGLLLFIAGVVQKVMNSMEPLEFKKFLNTLDKTAMTDFFAVTTATVPIILLIAYFVVYGFNHWWFIAGVVVWAAGSMFTKVINMPVYKWVGDSKHTDSEELRQHRRTLQRGNRVRALLTLASVLLMTCQINASVVALATVASVVFGLPSMWLAHKYIPNRHGAHS